MYASRFNSAFTLVELSIVLVILGLLTGGILAGQSLIRASELRAVSTEFNRYVTATNAFRDKYFGLPGDITNATAFWGRLQASSNCITNSAASVVANGVCDGNADTMLVNFGNGPKPGEGQQYWQQLANAGLIEGTFSGLSGTVDGDDSLIGINSPASRLPQAGWQMKYYDNSGTSAYYFNGFYGNNFNFGAQRSSGGNLSTPVFKPEEAWNIDTKLDDGLPVTGKIVPRLGSSDGMLSCAVKPNGTAANKADTNDIYNLSISTTECALIFRRAF